MPEIPTRDQVVILADAFERSYPHEIIAWAAHAYGQGLVMATGFGPEGVVSLHILNQVAPQTTVFYLDTDLFFSETYKLKDELEGRFKMKFERVATPLNVDQQAEQYGANLWEREPDQCCRLRKVLPLREYLKGKRAWITAIRRDQTAQRATARAIEWDAANGLVKVNPLINWTYEQVWTYLYLFELPVNPLHHQGYPSIGCAPCTRPVAEGADPRSGLWVGREKVECGIHIQEGNKTE
jgi:phosphoadenosine phosphosulfate reductase